LETRKIMNKENLTHFMNYIIAFYRQNSGVKGVKAVKTIKPMNCLCNGDKCRTDNRSKCCENCPNRFRKDHIRNHDSHTSHPS
jgi:hypothetical protein